MFLGVGKAELLNLFVRSGSLVRGNVRPADLSRPRARGVWSLSDVYAGQIFVVQNDSARSSGYHREMPLTSL
jgi:hypothetical protein